MTARADFYHQGPVWQDMQGPATGINPAGLPDAPTVETDLSLYPGSLLFSATLENVMGKALQLPHGMVNRVHPHIHYQRTAAGSGAIVWQMRHRIVGDVAGSAQAWTDWATLTDVVPVQVPEVHLLASYIYIDVSALNDSAILWLQLRRLPSDAGDTYASAARLLFWDTHVQILAAGSEAEFPGA